MKKVVISLVTILVFCSLELPAQQEGGRLSLMVSPGVNLPLGEPVEGQKEQMFALGGGSKVSVIYTMPFAPWLAATGGIDYSLVPTTVEGSENSMSLVTLAGGTGMVFDPAQWFSLYSFVMSGYGQGMYRDEFGGSGFFGGGAGVSLFLSPSFGIGAGAEYRHYLGEPEPFYQNLNIHLGAVVRFGNEELRPNIDLYDIRFHPVFPVFYQHYDNHSLGSFTLKNTEQGAIKDVKVQLFIPRYMDSPKLCASYEMMKEGEERQVPLYALFTDNVLSITEGTKVAAEVIIEYSYRDSRLSKTETKTLKMYDRNAMTWDDDRKAAAFCTARDPEVLRFSKNVAGMVRDHHSRAINLTFRIAIGLFESLRLHGINYVVDPQTPYEDYSRDATVVDYVQFPSQTLEYRAGDCDDLSILYSTLLESIGTESAFITVPGHIYMAFSLGMTPGEAERLFWDTDDLIFKDEQTWVPVEVTMVQKGFLQAWEMGAKQWRKHDPEGTAGFYPIHEAWREYEPVGLSGTGSGSSFPPHEIVMEYYANAVSNFVEREIADRVVVLEQQIVESRNPAPLQNKIGVMYARYGILDKAKTFFEEAAKSGYTPAMINLGNILYLDRKFDRALEYFDRAHESRPGMPAALVGIAKVNHELENYGTVRKVYTELQQRSPETAAKYSYLVSGSVAKGRASALMDQEKVMWSEEQ